MPDDPPVLPLDPDVELGGTVDGEPGEPSRTAPALLAVIAAGGMLGSAARYGIARGLPVEPGRFPWATFGTNLAGSFVLGLLLAVLLERFPGFRHGTLLRAFAGTGILGAFTTMSTYEVEVALLLRDGHPAIAALYAVGSLVAGLVLAAAGLRVGRVGVAR